MMASRTVSDNLLDQLGPQTVVMLLDTSELSDLSRLWRSKISAKVNMSIRSARIVVNGNRAHHIHYKNA